MSPGFSLAAYEGQQVVLTGTLKELPSSLAFLQNGRVVADSSGLTPSSLPNDHRLVRKAVPVDAVRAAPGAGVKPRDIEAVLFSLNGIALLLEDGWLYDRNGGPPPADLDVRRSRELEPQYWHRWKSAGGGKYLIRRADARGQLRDDWARLDDMIPVQPWGGRPGAAYTQSSFYGSLATGGTYAKRTWRFQPDGRFTTTAYTQSGSGSMAAMNGFVAGQTSTRDEKGGQSTGFATGGGGTVTHNRKDAEGSGNRGTYTLDGYTLELRHDSGEVRRVFAFPWGPKDENAWINDASFSGAR